MTALDVPTALVGIAVIWPAVAAQFDGNWNVVVQTTNGHCGITQWGVEIRDGKVYAPVLSLVVTQGASRALSHLGRPDGNRVLAACTPADG